MICVATLEASTHQISSQHHDSSSFYVVTLIVASTFRIILGIRSRILSIYVGASLLL